MGHAQSNDLMSRHFCNIPAFKLHCSGFGLNKTCHRMQNGRFSGAVGADQCDNLAFVNFKGDSFNGLNNTIIYF